jgi:3D (Asp-Asp-Asp) domain-containing protein/peptidoglycan hydrolase CwlO-like protein
VRWRRESRLALGLALAVSLLLGVWFPGAGGAQAQQRAEDLRRQQAGLSARSQSALLSLYALDSRLAEAQAELTRVRARTAALRSELQGVRREAEIVQGNLRASHRLLGDRLRTLYAEGEPDAIAVLLGAESLDDAVTRLDELERSAEMGAQAASDARTGRAKLRALAGKLAARLQEVEALESRAQQTAAALATAREERVAYISSLARQRRLNARQIEALDSQARRVLERSQAVQSQATAAAPLPTSPLVTGTRTITVSSTGYSLPGHTATGLPVGVGVVAVDPSVIPLGTRMTIPGYGEGIAADTGGAVQGYEIDIWFPTVAAALAWGRRTVTITLH